MVPVAGFFDSLFSRILVSLGDVAIGSETANHPQLAYLRNVLNYGDDFKSGALRDTIGLAEEFIIDNEEGSFPVWRHDTIKASRLVTMCSRLQNSFFNCSKLLLPHVPVRIRLDRNSSAFSLLTPSTIADTYKIVMRSATLFIRKVKVAPHTVSMIEHRLASQDAVYPYMRTELRHFLIPAGSQSVKHPNIYNGTMPTRLLFAVCPSLGVSGSSFHNNPFMFNGKSLNINYVQFFVDNVPTAFNAFTPDFEKEDYVMSYIGLLRALRLLGNPQAKCPVTYNSFAGPNTIFGVDLSADMSNLAMPSDGSISVEVRFKNNVTESLNGLVIAEFRSCVYIDKNANVTQKDL